DGKWLSNFLADPHPVMPQMALTRDDVADVVRYIQSFNPNSIPVLVPEKDKKPDEPFRG
ncbi:MAG: cytochrome c, partial [Alphaproteobacteria bacterium]|nr:cytochrome c [Alphaproteobacteria bacterium]